MTATRRLRPLRAAPERVDALDGIRALAVLAVLVYHLDEAALPGGFLGVDVFFVLSGYLITTLLLEEWTDRGSIALGGFWRRRMRRLLPPMVVTLLGVALVTPAAFQDVASRVRGQSFAALAQVGNWFEAFAGRSYFEDIGRPPPLRHLWSLGVEGQFYLLWPLVVIVVLSLGGRRALLRVAAAGTALSFLAMALLYEPGGDPSRIYYGTDTRAGTLLVGALLALAWPRQELRRGVEATAVRILDAAGLLAAAGLVALVLELDGASSTAYRGGLLLAAALAGVLVASAVHPEGLVGRALSVPPLVWLGTRSYAVYLWHWPVIVGTRPGLDVDVHGWALLALRLALIVVLAEATTRLVDVTAARRLPASASWQPRIALASAVLVVPVLLLGTQSSSTATAMYVSPTTTLPPAPPSTTTTTSAVPIVAQPVVDTTTTTLPPAQRLPPPPSGLPPVPPDMALASPDVRAVGVGESVLMAAGGEVQRAIGPGTVIDADVARQPDDVLQRLAARRAAGYLDNAAVVIIQIGTNGAMDMRRMERMAELVVGVPRVVAVTIHVEREWGDNNNRVLMEAASRWPWLRLADWDTAATRNPEWLGPDGVHPNREGARQYAGLVHAAATQP